ncbi:MAG: sulfatase-like hydrolase/transferase, partial [Planctomycetota bacterium]
LTLRPQGTSELYDMQKDSRELNNVYGQAAYTRQQQDLQERMLNWYVGTSDVVPHGRDDRSLPKYEGI